MYFPNHAVWFDEFVLLSGPVYVSGAGRVREHMM
jgi:hypothetical protein